MSIVKCKECGKDISDTATACPQCGCPVKKDGEKSILSFCVNFIFVLLALIGLYYSCYRQSPKNTQQKEVQSGTVKQQPEEMRIAVCRKDEAKGIKFSDYYRTLNEYPSYLSDTKYTIPDGVVEIGKRAFSSKYRLQSITIPDSVIKIGDSAFAFCYDLQKITLGSNVTEIGWDAFNGCKNLHITIPANVTTIGERAFVDVKAVKVSPGNYHFYTDSYGALITVDYQEILYFPPSFTGHYKMPDNITRIKEKAFAYCNLQSVTIPDSVRSIGHEAFYNCEKLKEVSVSRKCSIARNSFPAGCKIIWR